MRLTDEQRRAIEQRIRAAADALLRGELPPGGKPDITTLARQAQVSRAALYRSYPHLLAEFEQRLSHLNDQGRTPDPRQDQLTRLRAENTQLRQRIAQKDATISDLERFKTLATSRLVAQHDEIRRLRTTPPADTTNIRDINSRRTAPAASIIGPC